MSIGPILVAAGVFLVVAGILAWQGLLSWFGRLPGDIRIERPTARFYFPLTSMLLVSVLGTLLLAILRRFR